ncbi:MAG: FAD-dependent oxidoreductase, partial [Advenella sp.]|uniref:FAD-dependent oxidoreductase n=1 Tax=Advenella sp. TaxID=1872388 RepID=UPI003F9A2A5F
MKSVDACVIGAGLAGLSAALRAAEEGLSVIVLERGAEQEYMCNTRLTGGAFHVCLSDIQLPADELNDRIQSATEGAAHTGLSSAVAKDTRRAVKWLQSQGVRFIKGGAEPHHNFVLSPPSLQRVGADWRGRGGDVLLRTLASKFAKAGGVIERDHRAHKLIIEDGKCVGVEGRSKKGEFSIRANNVVIADGGFQCDHELIRENITPEPGKVLQRNARSGLGDGLKMARNAGAMLSDLIGFYGHV